MKIKWHTDHEAEIDYTTGHHERIPEPVWPDGWPVPRVGDHVFINWDHNLLEVTDVTWYPHGEDDPEPFVYVVLH